MRKRLRNIIIVLASFTILGGGGYVALMIARGNTLTPDGFAATGTIRLSVSPTSGFKVYLNEQEKQISTNNTLDNVIPGTYTIRIQRDGYSAWQQEIEVIAGLVSDISVQLFPGQLPPEQLTKTNVATHAFSNTGRYAYYIVTNSPIGNNNGIWRHPLVVRNLPLIDESPTKLTNLVEILGGDTLATLIPSPGDSRLLIKTKSTYYIIDAGRYNEPSAAGAISTSYPIDAIHWLGDERHLVIRSGNVLIDYNIETKETNLITYQADKLPIYSVAGSSVYYVVGNTLYKYTNSLSTATQLTNVTLPSGITAIHSQGEQVLVFATANSLYYLDIEASILSNLGNYSFISLAPSGRHLIVKNGEEYKSIEVVIRISRDQVQLRILPTSLPAKLAESSILWAPNSAYFLYQTDKPNQVFTADATGNNVNIILVSNNLSGGQFGITNDNSGIIVKLADEKTDDSSSRTNLYKLSLTPAN